jgi:hypothetical protein
MAIKLGKILGGILKTASPFAGLIPGVGIPLAAGLGAAGTALGRGLSGDKFSLGSTLAGGAGAGLGAVAAGGKGPGGLLKTLGKQFMGPDGKLDMAKLAAAGIGGANIIGSMQQRKEAKGFNQAQADLRNKLLSQVLAPSNLPGGRIA